MKYLSKFSAKKIAALLAVMAVMTLVFVPMSAVFAQGTATPGDIFGGAQEPEQFVDIADDDIATLIVSVLEILLSIVGLIAVVFLVWGGFKYMTASGDEERVSGAKSTIVNALIGLVIVLLAFALVRVVANLLQSAGDAAFMIRDLYV